MPKFTEIPHHILKDFCLNAPGVIAVTPDESEYFTIEITDTENGTINPSGALSIQNESDLTLTFTPEDGFGVVDIEINNVPLTPEEISEINNTHTYTIINITNSMLITTQYGSISCEVGTIGFTTQQMSINQTQTLTVIDALEGYTYNWETTTGSINPTTGTTVTYTAPSSNVNCDSNPIITLTCGGNVVDTVQIAVNQVTGSYAAYQINGECEQGCRQLWSGMCEYYYQYAQTKYTCSGNVYSGPSVVGIKAFSTGCNDTNYPDCTNLKVSCDKTGTCVRAGGCCNTFTVGTTDLRTAAQKTAGCCPAQLL